MGRHIWIAARLAVVTLLVFGVLYPLAMTCIAQAAFPRQANGSIVRLQGHAVGSELIGQPFTGRKYFHPRPSAAGGGYDACSSGGSNLGPSSRALADAVENRAALAMRQNPELARGRIPVDMVTASGSGLDPDISPANACAQLPRVARARGISEAVVRRLVEECTVRRTAGFLGEPRLNVLRINEALDSMRGQRR